MNEMISSIQVVNDNKQDLLDSLISSDKRLIVELEFVQNLSNMQYLHYLATNQYFEKSEFMNFLKYLRYWKKPEYARHMLFPQSLAILDALIDDEKFRREFKFPQFVTYCHQQQGLHWMKFQDTISSNSV